MIAALDPRVALVGAVAVAAWIGLLPAEHGTLLVGVAGMVLALGVGAGLSPRVLLVRSAAALPFVAVPGLLGLAGGTFDGREVLGMAGRGYTAALVVSLLVGVVPYPSLLAAASALGAPDLLVQTVALVHRYLEVVQDRAAAMSASALARGYGAHSPARLTVAGNLLGTLLLRSLDRGERVHRAMLARGYAGRFPTTRALRMRPVDWLVGASILAGCAASLWWLR